MNEENRTVKVVNIKQAIKYMQNDVNPLKVYYTNKIVYEFDKKETENLFAKWVNYEL